MAAFLLWLLLLLVCWPVALLALVLYPLVWLLLLPFRLVGIAVDGVFAMLRALVTLPARVLPKLPTFGEGPRCHEIFHHGVVLKLVLDRV